MAENLDLQNVGAWPAELQAFLEEHHELFLGYEQHGYWFEHRERRLAELTELLKRYSLRGWHCSRLTGDEIRGIERDGMPPSSANMLHRRIDARVGAGEMSPEAAERYKAVNWAAHRNREGKVCFCFFPPGLVGEGGIAGFLRHWGGEALYKAHPDVAALQSIGVPALIEAHVPIAWLQLNSLPENVVRRFLAAHGYQSGEPLEYEDLIRCSLPAQNIRRIIRYPEPDFMELTGCASWQVPLS